MSWQSRRDQHRADVRAAWVRFRAVACTHVGCGARAGEACRSADFAQRGVPLDTVHAERIDAFYDGGGK
jgi:hypothetical protein